MISNPLSIGTSSPEGTEVDAHRLRPVVGAGFRSPRSPTSAIGYGALSDQTTLPAIFPFEDVRRHRSSFWWV